MRCFRKCEGICGGKGGGEVGGGGGRVGGKWWGQVMISKCRVTFFRSGFIGKFS